MWGEGDEGNSGNEVQLLFFFCFHLSGGLHFFSSNILCSICSCLYIHP